MKILLISDPHIDFATTNKKKFFLQPLDEVDAIVCAGDVANDGWDFKQFLDWFRFYNVPKFIVPGNHDMWWARNSYTWNLYVKDIPGWHAPDPNTRFNIIESEIGDIMMFNFWYWKYDWPEGVDPDNYRDFREMDVDALTMKRFEDAGPLVDRPKVKMSISHMSPHKQILSAYKPNFLFVNPMIDTIIRAHESKLHLFGHTHEHVDQTIDDVRYVNNPVGYGFEGVRRKFGEETYHLEDLIVKC